MFDLGAFAFSKIQSSVLIKKKKKLLRNDVSSLTTLKYTQELTPFQSGRQIVMHATVMILASANMAYGI